MLYSDDFPSCPLLVCTSRLISAVNSELPYAYFLVLLLFYFVSIFCVWIGTIYYMQRKGNIFLTKTISEV